MPFSVEEFKQKNPQFMDIPDEELEAMYQSALEPTTPSPRPITPTLPTEEDTSFGSAISYAIDQPLENIGITMETLGAKNVGEWLRDITEFPENYESATEDFVNSQGKGFKWGYMPRALLEQAGQLAGSLATRAAGAGIGGFIGGIPGAAFGGLAGPGLFEAVQLLGPIALNRAKNNGRDEPNWGDWTAAASASGTAGLLNAIGIKNVGTLNSSLKTWLTVWGTEAITETTQSFVEQIGSTAGTLAGLDIDPKQAIAEGILGGTAAGVVQTPATILARNQEAAPETQDSYQLVLDAVADAEYVDIPMIRNITGIKSLPELRAIRDRLLAEDIIQKEGRRFVPTQNFVKTFTDARRLKEDEEANQREGVIAQALEKFNLFKTPSVSVDINSGVQFNQTDNSQVTNALFWTQDKHIDLKKITEQVGEKLKKEGKTIADEADPYGGITVFEGRAEDRIRKLENEEVRPMVKEMQSRNIKLKEADEFAQMRHALERNAHVREINPNQPDKGSGISDADALAVLKDKYGFGLEKVPIADTVINPDYTNLEEQILALDSQQTPLTPRQETRRTQLQEQLEQTEREVTVEKISYELRGGNQLGTKMQNFFANYVDPILQKSRDVMREGGLATDEEVDGWQSHYNYYVPLKGLASDENAEGFPPPTGKGMNISGRENRRVKGRAGVVSASPVLNAIADRTAKIIRSEKNRVLNELLNMVEENPNDPLWEVYSEDTPVFEQAFKVNYVNPASTDPNNLITSNVKQKGYVKNYTLNTQRIGEHKLRNMDELIGVKRNGKQHFIKINNPRLLMGLKNLGVDEIGRVTKIFTPISRYLSAINTSLNPEFIMFNFTRDIQTAVGNLLAEEEIGTLADKETIIKEVVTNTPSSIKTMWRGFRKYDKPEQFAKLPLEEQQYFDDFLASGAKADWFHVPSINEMAKNVEGMIQMQEGSFKGNMKSKMNTLQNFIEDGNSAVENGVRFATYKMARKRGVSRKQSAVLAKNLTINFNRKGMNGQTLNALYLFFNASVQGTANFLRGLRTSKRKQMAVSSLFAFAMAQAMLNEMWSDDDEDGESFYSNIEEHIKERNMIFMMPWAGEGEYLKIPLPYGYNIFHNLGTATSEMMMGIRSVGQASSFLTSGLLGSFNPLGFSKSDDLLKTLGKTVMPTAGVPLLEIYMNENFFGAPVYTENFPIGAKRADSALAKKRTSEFWKRFMPFLNEMTGGSEFRSGKIDLSPDVIEHLFGTAFGGAGKTFGRFASLPKTISEAVITGDLEYRNIPFVRRLWSGPNPYADQTDYFRRKQIVQNTVAEHKAFEGPLQRKRKTEFRTKYRKVLEMEGSVKGTDRILKRLRENRKRLENRIPKNSAEALKIAEQIEQIEDDIDSAYKKFNKRYNEKVGRFE